MCATLARARRHWLKQVPALVAVLVVLVTGCSSSRAETAKPSELAELLAQVRVAAASNAPGYDRACDRRHACVFGPANTDDHAGLNGHNGCDGFNDLARSVMTDLVPSTGCVVRAGQWIDPYTGHPNRYVRGQLPTPTVEHVVALHTAWDRGASVWPQQRRIDFANDQQFNLLLVGGPVNASKGDRSPSQWLPPLAAARCPYLVRYLQVSIRWDLPITPADRDAISALVPTCQAPPGWTTWPQPTRSHT